MGNGLTQLRAGLRQAAHDCAPAIALGVATLLAVMAGRLLPFGEATLLVRVADATPRAALAAAAAADAALVDIPRPGFAVLRGDAGHVRAALGLATLWKGLAPCSTQR